MSKEKWPALAHLCLAYFHQDWKQESGTPEGVLRLFAQQEGPAMAREAVAELELLQRSELSLSAKRDLLLELGCEYALPEGPAFADWLTKAVGQLSQAVS